MVLSGGRSTASQAAAVLQAFKLVQMAEVRKHATISSVKIILAELETSRQCPSALLHFIVRSAISRSQIKVCVR